MMATVTTHAHRDDPESAAQESFTGSETTLENGNDGTRRGASVEEKRPSRPVGFWHPELSKVRREVIVKCLLMTLLLLAAIMAVLSLYWGSLFRVSENMRSLVVYVVDFDGQVVPYKDVSGGPMVGPLVTGVAQQLLDSPASTLGYTILPPSQFNYDPVAVRQAVYDWDCYAAIYINSNATALLQQAVTVGNASYSPQGSVQFVIQTARDQTSFDSYINPQLDVFAKAFSAAFGPMWAQTITSNPSLMRDNLAAAASAINPGIVPLTVDLRPFGPAAAVPSVSIGLIYLIIMAFFSFSFFLPLHMKYVIPDGHPPLHYRQLVLWRLVATVTTYFFISLAYSLMSLAFQIPFWPPPASATNPPPPEGATAYGCGSFPVYWGVNFLGMIALGLACENVAMLLGMPWTALWLIFWVITNVSTSFYSLDLAPGFYGWGYAWPLHHIVEASRQTLFDLHSRIGLNVGVLFAWTGVNIALFPLCCYYMRWKNARDEKRK